MKRAIDSAASTVSRKAFAREIRRARVAALLPEIDGDADALVAVVLDGFDLAAAHRHGLAVAFGDVGLAGTGVATAGIGENFGGDIAQLLLGKTESLVGHMESVRVGGSYNLIVFRRPSPYSEPMHPARHPEPDDIRRRPRRPPPSKSQKKRDSQALQDLGGELIALSAAQLARIEMPDALRIAVRDAQRITSNGAKRRQMQYIGRLMRDADAGPIQAALDAIKGVSAAAKAREQRLERLRARLIENEQGLADITIAFPSADLQQLRQLRRNALKEQGLGKPPRAFREIFRVLRELDAAAAATPTDNPDKLDDDE